MEPRHSHVASLVLPVPWLLGLCRQDQRRGGMGSLTLVLLILLAWTLAVAWYSADSLRSRLAFLASGLPRVCRRRIGHRRGSPRRGRGGPALRLAAVFALGLGLGLLVVRGDGLDRETHSFRSTS